LEEGARRRRSAGRGLKVVMGVKGRGEVGKDGQGRAGAVAARALLQ